MFLQVKKNDPKNIILEKFDRFNRGFWVNFVKIFTDGSKSSDRCGFGVWLPSMELETHMDVNHAASIFTAEAEAIIEALRQVNLQISKKILIISDSKSVLTAVESYPHSNTHPSVFTIKSLLYELNLQEFDIKLLWVPSHCGIEGNERADFIASSFDDTPPTMGDLYSRDIRALDKQSLVLA